MKEYFSKIGNIIVEGAKTIPISEVESLVNIILNIIVFLGGVIGFLILGKLREKQLNSTFCFLSQFKIRIKYIKDTMETYKQSLLDYLIPETERRANTGPQAVFISQVLIQYSKRATDTLEFLMNVDEQIPASKDWNTHIESLIELLEDGERMGINGFCKWFNNDNYEQLKDDYYKKHMDNINYILNIINKNQDDVTKKIMRFKRKK